MSLAPHTIHGGDTPYTNAGLADPPADAPTCSMVTLTHTLDTPVHTMYTPGPLVRWLKVNFSESFCAWVHVKALRVFVESVLRYGLPVNFQAMLLHPSKKNTKRLRDVLNQLYGHLDSSALQSSGAQHDSVDIPGLGFGQSEYYAYVYYKINIDMVDTKV
uniref:V-type proton ATPase subunit C n=1 Tax=Timema shepardi TaxID=629360 RepID=A0A7R9G0B4_TIMSH|nr:unnamed protein product [Timema shepardi]